MRNPLNKRIPKEFLADIGKYAVIFFFVAALIAIVSGFFVSCDSVAYEFNNGFEKYNIEAGHFAVATKLDEDTTRKIESQRFSTERTDKSDSKSNKDISDSSSDSTLYQVNLYENFYKDVNSARSGKTEATIRVYKNRSKINKTDLFEGDYAKNDSEIAIDRMYAQNNEIKVGDKIKLEKETYTVCGLTSASDYSSLFKNNSDMMFDSINFCIGFVTDKAYNKLTDKNEVFNYAWSYKKASNKDSDNTYLRFTDNIEAKNISDNLKNYLKENVMLTDFLGEYANVAIHFVGDDATGDKASFSVFYLIVIVIIAFLFAVTSTATIEKEAGVIGTLRASGYTRFEVLSHYMVLPVLVTLVAAVVGNILGHIIFEDSFVEIYYNSYSISPYVSHFNMSSFVLTTITPIILVLVINFAIIHSKLKLSPLAFLRHNLNRKPRRRAILLNKKLNFMFRFRLRIIFQNIGNYIVLIIGILLASIIIIFGFMFTPLLEHYGEQIVDSAFCDYQYILKAPVETTTEGAEKYAVYSLKYQAGKNLEDDITIYGIYPDSNYVDYDLSDGHMYFSTGLHEKYKFKVGDTITLDEKYENKSYEFKMAGESDYLASFAIFMSIDDFREIFDKEDDYFTGYFSNEEIKDIDSAYILSTITDIELTKVSDQLITSMGSFMSTFTGAGLMMFILLMYILSKQIIERNSNSIAMIKILGYQAGEITGLYVIATSLVVIIGLLISVPITDLSLRALFDNVLYTMMAGYIPFEIEPVSYAKTIALGIITYALVSIGLYWKISKIDKVDALKGME